MGIISVALHGRNERKNIKKEAPLSSAENRRNEEDDTESPEERAFLRAKSRLSR